MPAGFDALGWLNYTTWSTINQKVGLFAAGGTMVATFPLSDLGKAAKKVTYLPQYVSMAANPNRLYYFDFWLQQQYLNVAPSGATTPGTGTTPATVPPAATSTTPPAATATTPPALAENMKTSITIMGHDIPVTMLAVAGLAALVLWPHDQGRRR